MSDTWGILVRSVLKFVIGHFKFSSSTRLADPELGKYFGFAKWNWHVSHHDWDQFGSNNATNASAFLAVRRNVVMDYPDRIVWTDIGARISSNDDGALIPPNDYASAIRGVAERRARVCQEFGVAEG